LRQAVVGREMSESEIPRGSMVPLDMDIRNGA